MRFNEKSIEKEKNIDHHHHDRKHIRLGRTPKTRKKWMTQPELNKASNKKKT